jgi:transcription termination factor NusB
MEILQNDPKMVLGENNKNLSHIIVVLSKAYNSDDSEEETNKLIEQFANGVLNNQEFKSVLDKVISEHKKGKTLNKIKGLFKLDNDNTNK